MDVEIRIIILNGILDQPIYFCILDLYPFYQMHNQMCLIHFMGSRKYQLNIKYLKWKGILIIDDTIYVKIQTSHKLKLYDKLYTYEHI